MRLSAASRPLPGRAALWPAYDPEARSSGIVHLGLGAFARAHLAAYTEAALAEGGGDWRILGASLRGAAVAAALNPQDGRYTLIEKGAQTTGRVIGAVAGVLAGREISARLLAALADPACRIVSLTVTEKGYGIDRAARGADPAHPAVAADLAAPQAPQGVLGLLAEALRRRFAAGVPPFTVLSCDNLPGNGALLRDGTVDFARRLSPALADRIAAGVAFPSCMVDRITPAATAETLAEAGRLTGYTDLAAVETEPFAQWVVEDRFPLGRPAWEAGGALFAADVAPYEAMKLRMLNGSHSMLAYAGFHARHPFVRDVMADTALAALVRRHLRAAAATLAPLPGIDFAVYAGELEDRFRNPAIAHATFQIAMDGSEKMPQRIFAAVPFARDLRPFAFATAAWLRHLSRRTHDCAPYELRDPRAAALARAASGPDGAAVFDGVAQVVPIPAELRQDTVPILDRMLARPMAEAIREEAARA